MWSHYYFVQLLYAFPNSVVLRCTFYESFWTRPLTLGRTGVVDEVNAVSSERADEMTDSSQKKSTAETGRFSEKQRLKRRAMKVLKSGDDDENNVLETFSINIAFTYFGSWVSSNEWVQLTRMERNNRITGTMTGKGLNPRDMESCITRQNSCYSPEREM